LERSVIPWGRQLDERILKAEGMRDLVGRFLLLSHPFSFQDACFLLTYPGVYASLQPLATISLPIRGRATESVSIRNSERANQWER
jgi:hypothetical protein